MLLHLGHQGGVFGVIPMAGGSQWRSVLSERDSSASCMSRNCPTPNASGSRLGKFGVSKQPRACIFWNPALLL